MPNGMLTGYRIALMNQSSNLVFDEYSSLTLDYTFQNLAPFTEYSVRVAAFTHELEPYSHSRQIMTQEAGKHVIII